MELIIFSTLVVHGQELNLPKDYNTLLEAYKDMYTIAKEYKKTSEKYKSLAEQANENANKYELLYQSTESDIKVLTKSNENLQELIKSQSEMIKDLMTEKNIGIITGVNIVPAEPKNSGVILAFNYHF